MQSTETFSSFFTLFVLNRMLSVFSGLSSSFTYKVKRTLFVFSVYTAIDIMNGASKTVIRDINGRLHLSDSSEMCTASVATGRCIWTSSEEDSIKGIRIEDMATNPLEREFVTDYFLKRCPSWLTYGCPSKTDMRRDLSRMFKVVITRDAH